MAGLFSRLKQRNKAEHPYCAAVVAAAGAARRMEGIDKILADLGGVPILARTLLALERCEKIDEIIIVTRSDLCVPVGKLCRTFAIDKAKAVVQGGTPGQSRCGWGCGLFQSRRNWLRFTTGHVLLSRQPCWIEFCPPLRRRGRLPRPFW